MGYASALTVPEFDDTKPYRLSGLPWRFIPCPQEVGRRALDSKRVQIGMSDIDYEAERRKLPTCMSCGLCLGANKRFEKGEVIVFEEHGPQQSKAAKRKQSERANDPQLAQARVKEGKTSTVAAVTGTAGDTVPMSADAPATTGDAAGGQS